MDGKTLTARHIAQQYEEVQEYNRMYKELDDLYHEIALGIGMSDGEFSALYAISSLGDGCLQRDICREVYVSKQTINSAVRKLERKGILYLEEKKGRDKKIFLTEKGKDLLLRRLFRLWRWKTRFSRKWSRMRERSFSGCRRNI